MAKTPSILPLKIFVISFGLLLMGGTIFVVAALVDKANKMQPGHCADATVSLSKLGISGAVSSVTPQDKVLLVTVQSPDSTHVLTLDRCTGNLMQQLKITP